MSPLQCAATGFAEVAQWIHLVDQRRQVDECPVRGKIGLNEPFVSQVRPHWSCRAAQHFVPTTPYNGATRSFSPAGLRFARKPIDTHR